VPDEQSEEGDDENLLGLFSLSAPAFAEAADDLEPLPGASACMSKTSATRPR
jgi:hypothetical protein